MLTLIVSVKSLTLVLNNRAYMSEKVVLRLIVDDMVADKQLSSLWKWNFECFKIQMVLPFLSLNTISEVYSASNGLHRSHIVAPSLLYRYSTAAIMPNSCATGTDRGYVGSYPWLNPKYAVSPPWAQPIPVYYGYTRWSYGGETDYAGRATVMPRISKE